MRVPPANADAFCIGTHTDLGNSRRFSALRGRATAFRRALGSATIATVMLLGALAGSSGLPSVAHAQIETLRISHQYPADIDTRDRAVRVFMEEVKKRAPHLQMSVHPALSLGLKVPQQIDAMINGDIAMCVYALHDVMDRAPEFAIAMMPFVPADPDMAARLKGTLFHKRLQSLAEANGFHILTWWWLPAGIASRQREIAGPPSVKGLGLRTPGLGVYERMFEVAGGRRTEPVAASQMTEALRTGKIDAAVMSLESHLAFRTYETTKYLSLGAFMDLQPLLISKLVWDGLTLDEQVAMEGAAEVSDRYLDMLQRDVEQKAVEAFTKAGAKIHPWSIDEYEAWSRIAKDTIWPEYRKLSPTADALFVAMLRSLIQSGRSGSQK